MVRDISDDKVHDSEVREAHGEQVKRHRPKADGVYIQGTVQGIRVVFTADTGDARTVLADRVYQRIPEDRRPRLNDLCLPHLLQLLVTP